MKQHKNRGFTLVELIIVLVILTILIALLVPALTGYIKHAKEKSTLAECRMVVEAAQTTLSQKYGEGAMAELDLNVSTVYPEVLKLSETTGELSGDIQYEYETAKLTYLEYTSANNITVVYDVTHNPNYYITTATSKLFGFISDSNRITKEYLDTNPAQRGRENVIEQVEKQLGSLPKVDSFFTDKTQYFKNKTLYWRPYYIKDGDNYISVLFASTAQSGHAGWNANLIYVNGKLYEAPKGIGISELYKQTSFNEVNAWLTGGSFSNPVYECK